MNRNIIENIIENRKIEVEKNAKNFLSNLIYTFS